MDADASTRGARIDRAATLLVQARRHGAATPPQAAPSDRVMLASLPADAMPRDLDEAYAIQHAVTRQLGAAIGGWKVAMDDAEHGRSAPLYASDVLTSPATLAPPHATRVGIEPEIAFRMARSLPPQAGAPYTRAQVVGAIGSAHAAIEVVVSRFATHEGVSMLEQQADNISNAALVLGPALSDWQGLPIAALPLRLTFGARTIHQGIGGHPLGDPLLALHWLANHLARHGNGLEAGQVVTTGSCAGLNYLAPGERAVAVFTGLGEAALERPA